MLPFRELELRFLFTDASGIGAPTAVRLFRKVTASFGSGSFCLTAAEMRVTGVRSRFLTGTYLSCGSARSGQTALTFQRA